MLTETMTAIVQTYHTNGMSVSKIVLKLGLPVDEVCAAINAAYPEQQGTAANSHLKGQST